MIKFNLGKLRVTLENDAVAAWIIITIAMEVLAIFITPLGFWGALLSGAIIATLHFIGQFVHQWGHFTAARWAGYPMRGIRYTRLFSYSEYPKKEKGITDRHHIQRSLGGVGGTLAWLLISGTLFLATRGTAPAYVWIFAVNLIDAALLFLVSALYSDGLIFIRNKGWR